MRKRKKGFSFLSFLFAILLCLYGVSQASEIKENAFPSELTDIIQKQKPFLEGMTEGMAGGVQNSFQSLEGLGGLTHGKDAYPPFFGNQQSGQGGPMPGQPMPGQPMPGQPMPGQPMPGQPMPGQPMPGQMPGQQMASPLEGCWVCQSGQNVLIMIFMNGMCGITANGQQIYGPYSVSGSTLFVQFANGKTLNVTFSLSGNQLTLSNGLVLQRQTLPAQAQQGMPAGVYSSTSPLEGSWRTRLPNGVTVVFVFKGNQYAVLANGQMTEQGNFTLQGNRLEYTITQGQAMGQKGVNTIQMQGAGFIMILPNGMQIAFQRAM
ncbi:MAG: hypothetical protein IJU76_12870 [Desulfovibrionaceae bacterium]|nr:hypothetical protein [Desulfovibrionaceae bacterium]